MVATCGIGGATYVARPRNLERTNALLGWRRYMQPVRPIAERVLRYVFRKWLSEAAKLHHL